MSAPRILLAPTHRTELANALAATISEAVARQGRSVRYHHLGVLPPPTAWDRWEGSSFLDPSLYDTSMLLDLYDRTTRGAQLSVLSSNRGLFDSEEDAPWTPAEIARDLDAPIVLVADCRGWGTGFDALLRGFNDRAGEMNLEGVVLTGVEDVAQRQLLRAALANSGVPVVGCLYQGGEPGWDSFPTGAGGTSVNDQVFESVYKSVDVPGLEALAGQRGFLAGSAGVAQTDDFGPLILVAGGRGFTPWSRDSIEILRAAGARVRRLDLLEDSEIPAEAAGLVMAGHLWVDALEEIAMNYSLMRHVRVCISEGLPTLALGGGMLYLLKELQDPRGRTHHLAGLFPSRGEIIADLEQAEYLELEAVRDNVLFREGDMVRGWLTSDTEVVGSPVSQSLPFRVGVPGGSESRQEGVSAAKMVASRVLFHLASAPHAVERLVEACRDYSKSI